MALDAAGISFRRLVAIARVGQSLLSVQRLVPGLDGHSFFRHRLRDIDGDAANRVDKFAKAFEVDQRVMVDLMPSSFSVTIS